MFVLSKEVNVEGSVKWQAGDGGHIELIEWRGQMLKC